MCEADPVVLNFGAVSFLLGAADTLLDAYSRVTRRRRALLSLGAWVSGFRAIPGPGRRLFYPLVMVYCQAVAV